MKIFQAALGLCLVAALQGSAQAGPVAGGRGGFSSKFIGEGGGYVPPTLEANDAMEYGSWQQPGLWETIGDIGDAPKPQSSAAARSDSHVPTKPKAQDAPGTSAAANSKTSWPFAQRQPSARQRSAAAAPAEEPVQKYSLWEGLKAPLLMPAQEVKHFSPDKAYAVGGQDYDSHVLNQAASSRRNFVARFNPSVPLVQRGNSAAVSPSQGEVLVAVNLNLKGQNLRDAITSIPGFSRLPGFEPEAVGLPGQVKVFGRLASDRVGEVLRQKDVARLEIFPSARRLESTQTVTKVLIGLRPTPGLSPGEDLLRLENEMRIPGFKAKFVTTESAPGTGEAIWVVKVVLPVAALSKLQACSGVLKVVPAPPSLPAAAQGLRSSTDELSRFFSHARAHRLLFFLSLLMLIPAIGDGLFMVLHVFVPYRR